MSENVQFTVYRPNAVRPGRWYTMLAFAHLAERSPDAPPDQLDPVTEVERQAGKVLENLAEDYKDLTQDSAQPIPRYDEITFVPDVPGIRFNPSRRTFCWEEGVHREDFRLLASPRWDGKTARGRMTVLLGVIIVAEITLSLRVDSACPSVVRPTKDDTVARCYRRILASYSRNDSNIVQQVAQYAKALGDQYYIDVDNLRAGENWEIRLKQMIEAADIFQLFWSRNSMHSPFVRQEWEHALSFERDNFVRPCYWELPLPEDPSAGLPPFSLRRLHFQRIYVLPDDLTVSSSDDPHRLTQPGSAEEKAVQVPTGTCGIQIEYKPVGNFSDPNIGGRVIAPNGQSVAGFTIEFVDTKTRWRSGRITLGAEGVFMTQLYLEKQRKYEFTLELCDPTGTRIPTEPERVSFTVGLKPEEKLAAMTISVGLANGTVATYVKKGAELPRRKSLDHYSTVSLRSGHEEDELHIPLLEGEHPRAVRNHSIGVMTIRGTDLRRDLPTGSQIEITLNMEISQQIRLEAYINSLDQEFEILFDPQMKHNSLEDLRQVARDQKERLASAREKAERTGALMAEAALARIEGQHLLEHVYSLADAAENDPNAVAQLDLRLRELAGAVDDVEDSVEWPLLLEKAEDSRRGAERVVEEDGETADRNRLQSLKEELQPAIDSGNPDLIRRYIAELDNLSFRVLDRQPGFRVASFNWLIKRAHSMRDPRQAEQIISQGRRAINNDDVAALKAAYRQIMSLLQKNFQEEAEHANIGGTIVRG